MRCGYRIGEMCSEMDLSERYVHEVFTRDIGLPPKEWMRWERMVVARRMLTGGKTLEQVSGDLGFAAPGSFRREFLSVHGVSPARFQREVWGLETAQREIGNPESGGGMGKPDGREALGGMRMTA